eukprot:UN24132
MKSRSKTKVHGSHATYFCSGQQLVCTEIQHPLLQDHNTILFETNYTLCSNAHYICRRLAFDNRILPVDDSLDFAIFPTFSRVGVPIHCDTVKIYSREEALDLLRGEVMLNVGKSLTRRFSFALTSILYGNKKDDAPYHEPHLQLIGENANTQVLSCWHGMAWDTKAVLEEELNSLKSLGTDWLEQLLNYR